jgi:hypothetical protein
VFKIQPRSGIKDLPGLSSEGAVIAVRKTPVEILVHRSPLKARLYLFSVYPRIFEVIIQENAEPGRNDEPVSDGNGGVIFGNVPAIKGRRGCALGHGRVLAKVFPDYPHPQPPAQAAERR